eukprot:4236653-Karenia_brevis.AAC.1
MHRQYSLHAATVGSSGAQQSSSSPSKNRRHQLHLSRLQSTIDNLKQCIQDKDDIIYGLRARLATASHASPIQFSHSTVSATAGHSSPALLAADASPMLFDAATASAGHPSPALF